MEGEIQLLLFLKDLVKNKMQFCWDVAMARIAESATGANSKHDKLSVALGGNFTRGFKVQATTHMRNSKCEFPRARTK